MLLGAIRLYRQEVRPFTDKQIALSQNFAAQAVIAMENARLHDRDARGPGAADRDREVLQVINSSPGDLAPVFDAMLEKAMRLCECTLRASATRWRCAFAPRFGRVAQLFEVPSGRPSSAGRGTARGRIACAANRSSILAMLRRKRSTDQDIDRRSCGMEARTILGVPLCARTTPDRCALLSFGRRSKPFTEKQIALVQNFAAQAVIAMENARLYDRDARSRWSSRPRPPRCLQVINSSPGDLAPVFDAMLEKAHSLCGIAFGSLEIYEAGKFHAVAVRGAPDSLAELLRQPIDPLPGAPPGRLLGGERIVQSADYVAAYAERAAEPSKAQRPPIAGGALALYVPLRKDVGTPVARLYYRLSAGGSAVLRQEIALLQNFAAQAVIAMENARLFNETREALEQQTASRICGSPSTTSATGVAMFDKAQHLCGLRTALWNVTAYFRADH